MEGLLRIAPCYSRRLIGDIVAVEEYPLPPSFNGKNACRIGRTDEVTYERARRQLESGWRPSKNTDVRCFWALGKAFGVKRCFTLGVQRSMPTTLTIISGRIHVFTRDQQQLSDDYFDGELKEGYLPMKLTGFQKTELEKGNTFNVPPLHCYVIVAQSTAVYFIDPAVVLFHVPTRRNRVQPAVYPEQPPVLVVQPPARVMQLQVRVVQPPVHAMQPPARAMQPQVPVMQPQVLVMQPPVRVVQPPVCVMQPQVRVVEPPVRVVQPPVHVMRPLVQPEQPRPHPELPRPHPEQPRPHPEQLRPHPEQPRPHQEQPRPHPERPRPYPEQPRPHPERPRPYPEQPCPHPEQPRPDPEQPRPHPEQPRPHPEQPRPYPEQPHPHPEQPRQSTSNTTNVAINLLIITRQT